MKRSEQVVPLPGTLRGDDSLRKFSEDVRRGIQALRDQGGRDEFLQVAASPFCPLTPHFLRLDGTQWKVQWRPGFVYEFFPNPAGVGAVTEREIYIAGTALSATIRPDLDIALGDYLYLHFETSDHGELKELASPAGRFAELKAFNSAKTSTFHRLPDGTGSNGVDGDYYLLIGQVETVDGKASISKSGWRGNFCWKSGWNALENVGTGEKIFKDYNIATDTKRLRSLVEKASDHQINISQNGDDEIRIEGNGKSGSLVFKDSYGSTLYTLTWSDGLITNSSGGTVVVG